MNSTGIFVSGLYYTGAEEGCHHNMWLSSNLLITDLNYKYIWIFLCPKNILLMSEMTENDRNIRNDRNDRK
jgi:hypothetical protein